MCAAALLTVLLVACRSAAAPGGCCPQALAHDYVGYAALARQVDEFVGAPRGATGVIEASGAELTAYLSADILPLSGATGYHGDVLLAPDSVAAVLRDSADRPLACVGLLPTDAAPGLRLSRVCLGPLSLPAALVSPLNEVLAATLGSGELGVSLLDARVVDDRLYLTLRRY
jgi:hypothetical protein